MINNTQQTPANQLLIYPGFEYRSELEVFGWPLVHITKGYDPLTGKPRVSKGVIAIGEIAFGAIALGGFALGGLAIGGGGWGDRSRRSGDRYHISRWNRSGSVSSSRWGSLFATVCDGWDRNRYLTQH